MNSSGRYDSPSSMMASLRISKDPVEVERLITENNDLKRQIAGGGLSGAIQIDFEELDIQDNIGGGGFSLVYRGYWKGTPVAIKKWFDPSHTDQLMQEFREEVMTLAELRHPNVLQFLGAVMKLPNLCMVTEHMPFSLHHVLYQSGVDMDKKKLVAIVQDICRAFIYLHSRRPAIVHRDVKPANFLLDRAWKVKICDFGLASNSKAQAGAGTPQYMAPELFENKSYSTPVDVYAFGVVLNEMCAKEPPFSGMGVLEVKDAVLAGKRPDIGMTTPKVLSDIIKKCWDQSAANRPTFVQLLEMFKEVAKVV